MSGSGRETLPNVRNALPDIRQWSRDPTGFAGVVGRPYQMSRTPSRMSRSGRETLPDVREWSGGPPICPEVLGRPLQMSGSVRETLPNVREALPDVR